MRMPNTQLPDMADMFANMFGSGGAKKPTKKPNKPR